MLDGKKMVELPAKGVQVYAKGKYRYAYKVTRAYRNAKGRPTCDRRSIGRVDDESGMLIPNLAYYEFYGEPAGGSGPGGESRVLDAGVSCTVDKVLGGLGIKRMLDDAFGARRASLLLTVVAYMLCEGNTMSYLDDFCERSLVDAALDDRRSSELFSSLTHQERSRFFSRWVCARAEHDYIAYDVTSFSSYSKGMEDAEWGYNRDGERLPQINLAMYMGVESRLPVFYRTYAGSIVDKSHLVSMMEGNSDLGVEGVTFVMDRGFASTANLRFMHERSYPYILGIESFRKAVRGAIDDLREELSSSRSWLGGLGCHGAFKKGMFFGVYAKLCVYYDAERAAQAERDLERRLEADEDRLSRMSEITQAQSKRYAKRGFRIRRSEDGAFSFERDYDVIDKAAENLGYFCILTSDLDADPASVLRTYRRRDLVEKAFDEVKNHLDMHRLRTHGKATTDGKMFCAFIALIVRMFIENALSDWMDENHASTERVIRELAKIRAIKGAHGMRLLDPLTKKQREIVEGMGFTEDDVRSFIEREGRGPV